MTTSLGKFKDAYATMTIAEYEPLILKWYSGWTIFVVASVMAWRVQKAKYVSLETAFSTAQALFKDRVRPPVARDLSMLDVPGTENKASPVDASGRPFPDGAVQRYGGPGLSQAVAVGNDVYPAGVLNVEPDASSRATWSRESTRAANAQMGAKTLPTVINRGLARVDEDFDFLQARKDLFAGMNQALIAASADKKLSVGAEIQKSLSDINGLKVYEFFPPGSMEEALSPIGIAHFYRQLYFNAAEGIGPIEQAFTVAPREVLEVVYETSRKQIHEETIEVGSETVSETAKEVKNLDEVSDKVSSMIQRDTSAAMSLNASGNVGVYQMGASASLNLGMSSQRSREDASKRLQEMTQRASERITKSFTIKTRDLEEITTTNMTRRTIANETASPVSYGLRRVLRRVNVKVQDLGPRLVWQLYVRDPGVGLARSKFVHYRESQDISVPSVPPGVRSKPVGGTATGTTSSDVGYDKSRKTHFVRVVINCTSDQEITAVSIDSITDLEGGGKDDLAPSPRNDVQWDKVYDQGKSTYTVKIAILLGDGYSVTVNYTYSWKPSAKAIKEWEQERDDAIKKITDKALEDQFEREKKLITERSKIKARPANDLRMEERYEVMNRMVSHLFERGDDPSEVTPLEIEYFHRYFDIDAMFVYLHPSWWRPRYAAVSTGFGRKEYEITGESEPAPLGSSLGWAIQLDGDDRRNAFLNSPWVRVCLPMRPGREREAVAWLAKHIEGEYGYNPNAGALRDLLKKVEQFRQDEDALGIDGPNYVKVDSTVGAPANPLLPESLYPIVHEFEVTVPTEGFVYDELQLTGN